MRTAEKRLVKKLLGHISPESLSEDFGKTPDGWWRFTIGMGDAIAFAGAAVELSKKYGEIIIPCDPRYERSIASFYVNYPAIRVMDLEQAMISWCANPDQEISPGTRLILGKEFMAPGASKVDMYEYLYGTLDVPYEKRWDSCPIARASLRIEQRPCPEGKWIFIHDRPEYRINDAKFKCQIYRPFERVGESILAFRDLIENAAEVWAINSGPWWLTEHLNPKGELHACWDKRPYLPVWQEYKHRKPWIWHK